jgi:hypothetical protein
MRKQDEPSFDQDGSILMNHEGKKPRTVGTESLKVSHKVCGRSISKGLCIFMLIDSAALRVHSLDLWLK